MSIDIHVDITQIEQTLHKWRQYARCSRCSRDLRTSLYYPRRDLAASVVKANVIYANVDDIHMQIATNTQILHRWRQYERQSHLY